VTRPDPRALFGVVELHPDEAPASSGSQRVACYACVVGGEQPEVPQVYVMVNGTSYCVRHAHPGSR
jgi:hypothetical protein